MTYGSMFNHLYARGKAPEPEVGMGATMLYWSDRRAATVVEVERFKTGPRAGQVKAVVVQQDKATRTDNHGMSDAQTYEYERDPQGPTRRYRLVTRGKKAGTFQAQGGGGLLLGARAEYFDYSF